MKEFAHNSLVAELLCEAIKIIKGEKLGISAALFQWGRRT